MTTLTKNDRSEILEAVLTETFGPRFETIRKEIEALLVSFLMQDHAVFCDLMGDEKTRPYLATTRVRSIHFQEGKARRVAGRPVFGSRASMPIEGAYRYIEKDGCVHLQCPDVVTPASVSEFSVVNEKVATEYNRAWSDYGTAFDKLDALLNSYTSREKFVGDFPEFTKYLPSIPVKMKLPMVIVKDVRKELSKLGIPAK